MEFEEIIKKVQWIEDQERKGKTELKDLSDRVTGLNSSIGAVAQHLKTLAQQINDLSVAAARMEQFDQMLAKHRVDVSKSVEAIDKNATRREQEATKIHQSEMEDFRKIVFELKTAAAADQTARKDRTHEDQRRLLAVQDLGSTVDTALRMSKELQESHKSIEDSRRQDAKRMTDLQAEISTVRKRVDEARERSALHADNIRNMENRINEIMESETGRQDRFNVLLQQQSLQQLERDRAWKDWQARYEQFRERVGNAESQVAAFEDSIRSAKQAQEAYDGLNQRLERRIAEVGEIQRLADERLRQEWIAFKADEQKRWTGHTLAQEESIRDLRKNMEKIGQQVATMDETSQTIQDQLQQTTDATERQLQELINVSQDWLAAYERIMGHSKSKASKVVR
jgi:chromosome segregation ATPase